MIVDNIDDLLKGLFRVLETDSSNAKEACLCLVNLSAKESGAYKIMSFIESDVDFVGFNSHKCFTSLYDTYLLITMCC